MSKRAGGGPRNPTALGHNSAIRAWTGRLAEAIAEWRGQGLVDVLQQAAWLPGSGQFPDDFTLVLFDAMG